MVRLVSIALHVMPISFEDKMTTAQNIKDLYFTGKTAGVSILRVVVADDTHAALLASKDLIKGSYLTVDDVKIQVVPESQAYPTRSR